MSKLLLDTHVLLWLNGIDNKLKPSEAKQIKNNKLYVSIVSYWEIAIKSRNGNLDIKMSINDFMLKNEANNIQTLNISSKHLRQMEILPKRAKHNDPFDHLIIATSLGEKINLKSYDNKVYQYFYEI